MFGGGLPWEYEIVIALSRERLAKAKETRFPVNDLEQRFLDFEGINLPCLSAANKA